MILGIILMQTILSTISLNYAKGNNSSNDSKGIICRNASKESNSSSDAKLSNYSKVRKEIFSK